LHAAFDAKSDLAEMCLALKNVVICQPVALTDQIRLAATVNLMRQQVLQAAEHLDTPPYRQKQSLDRMSGDRRAPVHRG
jgi:hypothetical protein